MSLTYIFFLVLIQTVVFYDQYFSKVFPKNMENCSKEEKVDRTMDWGIMSMIIFDLEPFNLVSRYLFLFPLKYNILSNIILSVPYRFSNKNNASCKSIWF